MHGDSEGRSSWRRLSSFSIASRLAATIVAVSVVSLGVATFAGLSSGRNLTNDLSEDQITALRTSGASDVAAQMATWSNTASTLAESAQAAVVVQAFTETLTELPPETAEDEREQLASLLEVYGERYIEPLDDVGIDVALRDVIPDDPIAVGLQSRYAISPDPTVEVSDVDDAQDGSRWSDVHRQVNPVYRSVVQRLDLNDLLIIEPVDGRIVYSVQKRADLGTSLDVGSFSGSVIAKAYRDVRDDPDAGSVIADLSDYIPAGLTPVGAIASPIMDEGELVGVMVLMFDSAPLTETLTADGEWDESGFPETAETFLIGRDGFLRSEPRTYIEDPSAHLAASLEAETITEQDQAVIIASGSTALTQRAVEETVNAGLDGDDSVEQRASATGVSVLSSTSALDIDGVDWLVVSEVDRDIADGGLTDFTQLLIIGASIFVVIAAFIAVGWSTGLLSPVREMGERLAEAEARTEPIVIPDRSPAEFRQLTGSFDNMMATLVEHRAELTSARARRIALLREMLPPDVAERVANGDLESLEEVPKASVAVVVVSGLGSLVRLGDRASGRELVDRLHGELDDIGQRHGVQRIKIVGDAYYAACGHSRPYIDHAPRIVSFAADAQDAVRELGAETSVELDVVAGAHTGPVMVGMTLASRMVYDVWGPTVSTAHHLARRGRPGQIFVSEATRALLPGEIETRPDPEDSTIWIVSAVSVGGRT